MLHDSFIVDQDYKLLEQLPYHVKTVTGNRRLCCGSTDETSMLQIRIIIVVAIGIIPFGESAILIYSDFSTLRIKRNKVKIFAIFCVSGC
jgi:hypothetical protein